MDDERPTFGSLFAGIGGIDLGLERAGWRGRWQVEYEPFCQRVLAKHWPDVTRYGDIHDVDWGGVEQVDLVAGGFPCQPFSVAGKQRGMDDDRWLWPEFERCLRALRPRYVLVENVPGLLVGRGMDAVLGGLADLGYDTEWESIPAAAVGAPHLRYRVWVVAYADDGRRGQRESGQWRLPVVDAGRDVPDAAGNGRGQRWSGRPFGDRPGQAERAYGPLADAERRDGEALDQDGVLGEPRSQGSAERSADGYLPGDRQWSTEPDVGRVAHGVPNRVDRLRSLGNAVVPQVVEFIGRRILEAEGVR